MRDHRPAITGTICGVAYEVRPNDSFIMVKYRGFPADLLAVGAVEPLMVEKAKKPNVAQYDSNGDQYRRRKFGKHGKLHIERMVTTRERARRLPGVPRDISTAIIDWLDQHPGEIHITKNPTIDGNHAWVHHYGTRELLEAESHIGRMCSGHRILDGYYKVGACLPLEMSERTHKDRVRLLREYLDCIRGTVADSFPPETQSRVDVHISAIMAEFDRGPRRPTERPSFLRLMIDNTKGSSAQV
jgi:hypothetical protein